MEESLLPHPFRDWLAQQGIAIRICGLGPIHAGIEASRMLAQNRMSQAILMGIAGAYDDSLAIGQASFFDRVACYGIGLGTGRSLPNSGGSRLDFVATATTIRFHASFPKLGMVLQSSADLLCFLVRCHGCPIAASKVSRGLREDMEAYAIAVACRSTNTPFSVVRGISNHAGDRDLSHWKIQEAMRAASDLLISFSLWTHPMTDRLHLGISTCPNDTFAFHGILANEVDLRGIQFDIELLVHRTTHQTFVAREFDIAKASFHAALCLASRTVSFLVGRLLATELTAPTCIHARYHSARRDSSDLCPGEHTTAHLLFRLLLPEYNASRANPLLGDYATAPTTPSRFWSLHS